MSPMTFRPGHPPPPSTTPATSPAATVAHDLPVDAVHARLAALAEPVLGIERVDIFAALDRILAEDVVSPMDVPPHDNSAMDGFAFDGAALVDGQPLALQVTGTVLAGHRWPGRLGPGQCLRIMTGAVMPHGADTVVPQEAILTAPPAGGPESITIAPGAVRRGDHRRRAGEDLARGRTALSKGTRLAPAALGLLASLGQATVPVVRRLRVAFFSTGDEILSLGTPWREGTVYDSNRYTLFGLLARMGVEPIDLGAVPDEPQALEATLRAAAARADAIVTSGGVSAGAADHTRTLLDHLGQVEFWRIAMRPGRPMAAGRIPRPEGVASSEAGADGAAVLFALPGNPVAAMVAFLVFVRPALWRMMGCEPMAPPALRALAAEPLHKRPGRTEYQRGIVFQDAEGTLRVRTTGPQGSGLLSSMVQADGLILLPHARGPVAVGEPVDVLLFDGML
ncbi:molybdopterin molybdenumtransferase MoeA [Paracidovorax avenae]|uniref:molybdopterin molybdotransferase MoeA n=1 Tax=Paracidovorax avenae TaxID=80867 RepID=UPI000D159CBE|nr:gephyrin-like molybdotransferase Glp [Paracidovorax avenae]AVS78033.1 molybdopterin molybdenumtransferase MoeA [Paracidovorax avenae]AVS90800.1 molybdopterin molybdenumtransferase MoeA [Paracidovorax avenae]AVT06156.1 molybdopterin molybdenumtransferase MoeA [Paracidovorax avenae]AVT20577.1 molybdopterin molybdenumtransferase MoeA [Paracidovorax avenae]